MKARNVPSVIDPESASQPPSAEHRRPGRASGSASSAGLSRAVSRAARIRSANSRRGPALQRGDLARLLAEALDHPDAGDGLLDLLRDVRRLLLRRPGGREQRPARTAIVTIAAAGSTTSATRVSSGESHSIAAIDVTTSAAVPSVKRHHRQQALHELQVA